MHQLMIDINFEEEAELNERERRRQGWAETKEWIGACEDYGDTMAKAIQLAHDEQTLGSRR